MKIDTTNEAFEELKDAVNREYRTDGQTLPAIPPFQDEEELKWMLIAREAILNPNMDENTVIKKDGTTLKEVRDAFNLGKMPKNAPKEAKDSVGKHTFSVAVVDGVKTVIVTAPNETEVVEVKEAPFTKSVEDVPTPQFKIPSDPIKA